MVFRRRGKVAEAPSAAIESVPAQTRTEIPEAPPEVNVQFAELAPEPIGVTGDTSGGPSFPLARVERVGGPWDLGDIEDGQLERVDLGGIRVPIVEGMELRAEIADDRVVAATLVIGRSAIQVQPFAAPRSMGIWDEVRAEIAEGIGQSGGGVRQGEGRFGTELLAEVPVGLPDGSVGIQAARFLGVDGPRWFLRAVITGEAAIEESRMARALLEDLFAEIVVVRGAEPMAPRQPIELRLPTEITGVEDVADEGDVAQLEEAGPSRITDFNPFERGPEITEIR
jgi:hypothetical protein